MRHSWFDPESRLGGIAYKPPLTPKPRHSGLDPESSPYPFMDPESKSPRELADVQDDVALEPGVERGTSIDASYERFF